MKKHYFSVLYVIAVFLFCRCNFLVSLFSGEEENNQLFFDDFEEGLDYDKWDVREDSDISVQAAGSNHFLQLGLAEGYGSLAPALDEEWEDYTLDYRFNLREPGEEGYCLNYFRTAGYHNSEVYNIHISPEGLSMQKFTNVDGTEVIDTVVSVDYGVMLQTWYEIRLICNHNLFQLFCNDELIFGYTDNENPYLTGKFRFSVSNRELWLDDIQVTGLGG